MLNEAEIEYNLLMYKYPFQNRQYANLPNETWKTIPMRNEDYMLSNYGRVKRLEKDVIRRDGFICHLPEHLKKPLVHRFKSVENNHEFTIYSITSSVNDEAKKYSFVVARYMYYLFVEKFSIDKYNFFKIAYRDGNPLNLIPENLSITTQTEIGKKNFAQGKLDNNGFVGKSRKVQQFNMHGNFIAEFISIRQASIATGIDNASIYRTIIGEYKQYKGFIFKEVKG